MNSLEIKTQKIFRAFCGTRAENFKQIRFMLQPKSARDREIKTVFRAASAQKHHLNSALRAGSSFIKRCESTMCRLRRLTRAAPLFALY